MYIKPDNTDLRTATVSHEATALAGLFEAKSTLSTTSKIPARVCACQAIDGRKKKKGKTHNVETIKEDAHLAPYARLIIPDLLRDSLQRDRRPRE